MAESVPSLILCAAVTTLLIDALDDEAARHLGDDQLRVDLRALQAQVEGELEAGAGRRRLRLADDAAESVVSDD